MRAAKWRIGKREKPLVAGDVNLIIMLRQVVNEITRSINKQPITTHLSVNNSQSEYGN